MKSYDYANRKGVHPLSWDDFAALSRQIAEALAPRNVDLIIGMARAGLFPATAVSCSLRRDLYPVRISRRVNDEVVHSSPVWHVPVPEQVAGKVVAVIDEIADTGESLVIVANRVRELGAAQVITACMVSHSWANPKPDICPLVSDEFVIFPWDQQVYINGQWQPHPEIEAGLKAQDSRNEN